MRYGVLRTLQFLTLLAIHQPIFVYRGRRTGGTAIMDAFAACPGVISFHDALHELLATPFSTFCDLSSDSWPTGHPSGIRYFEPFAPLVENDRIKGFERRFLDINSLPKSATDQPLYAYLDSLIQYAESQGRRAVVGLEMGEFLMPWIRASFPNALHLGITRSPEATLASWMEQWALGNPVFMTDGAKRVRSDPQNFGMSDTDMRALSQEHGTDLIHLSRRYIEVTNAERQRTSDCVIAMDDLGAQYEANQLVGVKTLLKFEDSDWQIITSRLTQSRPQRDLISSYATIAKSRTALSHHYEEQIKARDEHIAAVTSQLDSVSAHNLALTEQHAFLTSQLEAMNQQNTDLTHKYEDALKYSERPRLALQALRTHFWSSLRHWLNTKAGRTC